MDRGRVASWRIRAPARLNAECLIPASHLPSPRLGFLIFKRKGCTSCSAAPSNPGVGGGHQGGVKGPFTRAHSCTQAAVESMQAE